MLFGHDFVLSIRIFKILLFIPLFQSHSPEPQLPPFLSPILRFLRKILMFKLRNFLFYTQWFFSLRFQFHISRIYNIILAIITYPLPLASLPPSFPQMVITDIHYTKSTIFGNMVPFLSFGWVDVYPATTAVAELFCVFVLFVMIGVPIYYFISGLYFFSSWVV